LAGAIGLTLSIDNATLGAGERNYDHWTSGASEASTIKPIANRSIGLVSAKNFID